jgi:hypothetical protein
MGHNSLKIFINKQSKVSIDLNKIIAQNLTINGAQIERIAANLIGFDRLNPLSLNSIIFIYHK